MKTGSIYHLTGFVLLLTGVLFTTGCANNVEPAAQTDGNYRQSGYQGQVPVQTFEELRAQYPPGYWRSETPPVSHEDRLRVAVTHFSSPKALENTARLAAEVFAFAFTQSLDFDVYERDRLDAVARELELSKSGLVRPDMAAETGRFPGVDLVVTGTVSTPPPARR